METFPSQLQDQSFQFMLLLDGFVHSKLRLGLLAFKALATSHAVDVKSVENQFVTKVLHPCWKEHQIMNLRTKLLEIDMKD